MRRNTNRYLARTGEELSASYFLTLGYKILHKNFYTTYGEIDIIAIDKEEIVIAEVKTRTSKSLKSAQNSITRSKRKKLTLSVMQFIAGNPQYSSFSIRFDIVIVQYFRDNDTFQFIHYPNSFEPVNPEL